MTHSPATILLQLLVDAALVAVPVDPMPVWPGFISHLPDAPDNAVVIYDTSGDKDGRVMAGEVIEHPGVMVRVRAVKFEDGWTKCDAIRAELDTVHRRTVARESTSYTVQSVIRLAPVIAMGSDPIAKKRREEFSLNLLLTVKENP